ncbi:MAG: hypothetical protein Q7T41_02855 [Candidatus Saccharibacteria bacterium]|nr:hypothetical protein [Candidatus Saccharibacteria bacterium]
MKRLTGLLAIIILAFGVPSKIYAQSSSTNYSVDESSFSSGSGSGSSASFSSTVSAGDLGVGSAFSTNYQAYAGPISPNEEYLEMVVTPATIDLGTLTDLTTATGTAQFYVRAYLNSSYSVITASVPPTNENGDTLSPMTSTAAPAIATEQFGINLVNNASPNIGADPVPQPDSSYANGQPATGYDTVDQFRYNQGEVIAENGSSPAWGQTNYTISYIANISGITEAGLYQMTHALIAVSTF